MCALTSASAWAMAAGSPLRRRRWRRSGPSGSRVWNRGCRRWPTPGRPARRRRSRCTPPDGCRAWSSTRTRFVLAGMDAVDGTDIHAGGILGPDAGIRDDERHERLLLTERRSERTWSKRSSYREWPASSHHRREIAGPSPRHRLRRAGVGVSRPEQIEAPRSRMNPDEPTWNRDQRAGRLESGHMRGASRLCLALLSLATAGLAAQTPLRTRPVVSGLSFPVLFLQDPPIAPCSSWSSRPGGSAWSADGTLLGD